MMYLGPPRPSFSSLNVETHSGFTERLRIHVRLRSACLTVDKAVVGSYPETGYTALAFLNFIVGQYTYHIVGLCEWLLSIRGTESELRKGSPLLTDTFTLNLEVRQYLS